MALAVTHVLVPLILVDFIRDHFFKEKRRALPNKFVLLAGIAGLLPDIDIPISILLFGDGRIHRMITHTIWVPLLFLAGFIYFYYFNEKKTFWKASLMLFIGTSMHLILDATLSGYVPLFHPLSRTIYGMNLLPNTEAFFFYSAMDAILLLGWLIHEELEHKISDFF